MLKIEDLISQREIEELKSTGKYTSKNIKKIQKEYPSQYIIGYVDFYGNKIKVNNKVLIPRYETETLIYKTINYIKTKIKNKKIKILDLCTGSGCIAITLKKEIDNSVIEASDISSKALKVAKENAKINNVKIKFIKSNLFKKINEKNFDVIITNPPYIPATEKLTKIVKHEPRKALISGKYGTKHILKIINEYKEYLKKGGFIAIEIHETQKEILEKKLINCNLKYSFEKDLANKIRYLFIFNE